MLNALIIDDEPLAHEVVLHHLKAHSNIKVVGQFYNATQALSWLANNGVDLLFLDINMPELNGISMLKIMANKPQVIIISAYQEYAIHGYELEVADYLLKPVSAVRFAKAINKATSNAQKGKIIQEKPESLSDHIILKVDKQKRKFIVKDINFLEAYGNFVKLWNDDHFTLVSSTLKQLLERLPEGEFTQIHKSFAVNKAKVVAIETESITLECGRILKVTRSFKKKVQCIL